MTVASHILLTQQGIRGLRLAPATYFRGGSGLNQRVTALQTSLELLQGQLATMQDLQQPLQSLADSAGPLPASLQRLNESTAILQQLPGILRDITATMHQMAQHVANLDRKTGPTPP